MVGSQPQSLIRSLAITAAADPVTINPLSGWSNAGSKSLEGKGIENVICPVAFVRVLPDVVCDYCEEIHPKE